MSSVFQHETMHYLTYSLQLCVAWGGGKGTVMFCLANLLSMLGIELLLCNASTTGASHSKKKSLHAAQSADLFLPYHTLMQTVPLGGPMYLGNSMCSKLLALDARNLNCTTMHHQYHLVQPANTGQGFQPSLPFDREVD